jgi:hypothetical protein
MIDLWRRDWRRGDTDYERYHKENADLVRTPLRDINPDVLVDGWDKLHDAQTGAPVIFVYMHHEQSKADFVGVAFYAEVCTDDETGDISFGHVGSGGCVVIDGSSAEIPPPREEEGYRYGSLEDAVRDAVAVVEVRRLHANRFENA